MKRLTQIFGFMNDEQLFEHINNSFIRTITTWDYFVNWKKVFSNISPIEKELNLLNCLVGKNDLEYEMSLLMKQYPSVIKAFPFLIASREKSFEVLIDVEKFIYKNYDFSCSKLTDKQLKDLYQFVDKSGLKDILSNKQIKNLVDYAVGIEVGLDSNGRKNRSGAIMENIVRTFVEDYCVKNNAFFLLQASALKIKQAWNIEVHMDKSSRIIDFAILKNNRLYLIEVNFYGGGGSKLKSTATEYCEMYDRYNKQNVEFIWITDGAGWRTTQKPLLEYFNKTDYLLNISLLKNNALGMIIL